MKKRLIFGRVNDNRMTIFRVNCEYGSVPNFTFSSRESTATIRVRCPDPASFWRDSFVAPERKACECLRHETIRAVSSLSRSWPRVSSFRSEEELPDESAVRNRYRDALTKIAQNPPPLSDAIKKKHRAWSDKELVTALTHREKGAFAELYRRHQRSVSSCSRKILNNQLESDDVAAEVFIRFWLDPEKYDDQRGTLLTYLRRQARTRSNDVLSSRAQQTLPGEHVDHERRKNVTDIGTYVLTTGAASRLRRALTLLPPDEREPIELAFFGGMSYDAVAKHLRLPVGIVKSKIRAGIERLHSTCGAPSNWQSPHLNLSGSVTSIARRSSISGEGNSELA